jgi:hypothetical protein
MRFAYKSIDLYAARRKFFLLVIATQFSGEDFYAPAFTVQGHDFSEMLKATLNSTATASDAGDNRGAD